METSPGRFCLDGCYRPHHRSPQPTSTLCCHLGSPPHRRGFNEWWTRFGYSQIDGRWRNLGRTHPRTPQLQYGENWFSHFPPATRCTLCRHRIGPHHRWGLSLGRPRRLLEKNVRRCFRRNRAALLPRALCKSA